MKKKGILYSLVLWSIAVSFYCLDSCSQKQSPNVGSAAPAASGARVEQKGTSPAITQGIVTFLEGRVSAGTGADWRPISVGDAVPTAESVKTDSGSSCDLQFGEASAIRIGPDAVIELMTISLATGKKIVDLGLLAGAVTCKVNKLMEKDRFQIVTKTAVCAVRGTQFAVDDRAGKAITVAVREGAVAILPLSFDEAKLDALANSANESEVEAVVDSIVKAAPVVGKGQELSIASTDMAKADTIVALVQSELASTPALPTTVGAQLNAKPEEKPENSGQGAATAAALSESIAQSLKDYEATASVPVQRTTALSDDSKRLFERAATLEVKESLPEPPKRAPANNPPPVPISATPAGKAPAPAPVVSALRGTIKVSDAGLVSGLVAAGRTLFAADAKGTVFAFTADGTVLWSSITGNAENDNSRPVLGSGFLAFAGDKELSVLDGSNGKLRFSVPLDSSSSGLFGRRPAIAGTRLYLATANGIKVFDADSGASLGTIDLPDDVEMTPAVSGTTLYAASVGGMFYVMDGGKLSVVSQVKTSASQPYAAAPLISGGSAYFIDRKGLATCIDLGTQTVAWSKRVDAAKNLNVLQDSVLGDSGLYVFAKGTIYGLSLKTGERLFDPIGGASSPPAIFDESLWFGTQNDKIVAVDPLSGKTKTTLTVSARIVGAPVETGDLLAFPTESGDAIFVDPAVALR